MRNMKKQIFMIILLIVTASMSFAFLNLDLVGEWKPETIGLHFKGEEEQPKGATGRYFITEQNGHAFTGYKLIKTKHNDNHKEYFSGVISYDGKRLFFAEHIDGYAFADVVTEDLIYYYHLEDKDAKAIIVKLTRVQ